MGSLSRLCRMAAARRLRRDLMLYKGILSKLNAAKELMAEFVVREKRKQAEREAEKAAKAKVRLGSSQLLPACEGLGGVPRCVVCGLGAGCTHMGGCVCRHPPCQCGASGLEGGITRQDQCTVRSTLHEFPSLCPPTLPQAASETVQA